MSFEENYHLKCHHSNKYSHEYGVKNNNNNIRYLVVSMKGKIEFK